MGKSFDRQLYNALLMNGEKGRWKWQMKKDRLCDFRVLNKVIVDLLKKDIYKACCFRGYTFLKKTAFYYSQKSREPTADGDGMFPAFICICADILASIRLYCRKTKGLQYAGI